MRKDGNMAQAKEQNKTTETNQLSNQKKWRNVNYLPKSLK